MKHWLTSKAILHSSTISSTPDALAGPLVENHLSNSLPETAIKMQMILAFLLSFLQRLVLFSFNLDGKTSMVRGKLLNTLVLSCLFPHPSVHITSLALLLTHRHPSSAQHPLWSTQPFPVMLYYLKEGIPLFVYPITTSIFGYHC